VKLGALTSLWGTTARSARDAARWYDVTSGYHARDMLSLPRIDGWERDLGTHDLRSLRVAVSPDLGAAVVHPEIAAIVLDAAEALIDATGMRRVEATIAWPEKGGAWANAGAPGLYADLKPYWPDSADDLTFEIKYSMKWMENYRIWHAASVEKFRVEMTEAMADIFEQVDVVLAAVAPVEPFAAEGPMPRKVGDIDVSPFNGGALTIPANIAGNPAISIPAGLTTSGLPVGLQAITRRHDDKLLLDLARAMEQARPWPLVAPGAPI
jgi:aspartyl-tRNA(Asn)/glutamyl-tRNA(Gln) amidotransferase subunit A